VWLIQNRTLWACDSVQRTRASGQAVAGSSSPVSRADGLDGDLVAEAFKVATWLRTWRRTFMRCS
jgi:hypothetical protein